MPYQFKNITVLVIESSKEMFELTKDVLTGFGIKRIDSAFGFDAGFQRYCMLLPDLVIIDQLTPPQNGLALTEKIRKDARSPNPYTPIILMSGFTQEAKVMKARDAGITEFLAKPFTAKSLYQKIEQLIEHPRLFVKSEQYTGPDRRRKSTDVYKGPERRTQHK